MPTWDDVVAIGTRFPEVEVGTSFGTPALRVRGKGMCRLRTNPDALVLRVIDLGEREALLQGQPEAFFSTPHYDGYPYVLVRLEAVDPEELAELLEEAWRLRAPKRVVTSYDSEQGDAVSDDEKQPYAGPGRETSPRSDMPADHDDVKEFVEEVDKEVPDEHLESRVDRTFENRAEQND
jgi:hypothetical protein